MLSGTGYPSGENYPAGTGMELFFTRMRVRVTRRVKFCGCGYRYGWALPVEYVPVAISKFHGAVHAGEDGRTPASNFSGVRAYHDVPKRATGAQW
jgi:hypothetical protein